MSNTTWRRLAFLCMGGALLGFTFGIWGVTTAFHRPVAFYIDRASGEVAIGGRVEPSSEAPSLMPGRIDVEIVARRFTQSWAGFDSVNVEHNLAAGLNLLTAERWEEEQERLASYEAERGRSFAAHVKLQGIRTTIDVEEIELERNEATGVWAALVRATRTQTLDHAPGQAANTVTQDVRARLSIVELPRDVAVPHAALVDQFAIEITVPRPDDELLEETVRDPSLAATE